MKAWASPQTMTVLHELGHGADFSGLSSDVLADTDNSELSMENQDTIEQACF